MSTICRTSFPSSKARRRIGLTSLVSRRPTLPIILIAMLKHNLPRTNHHQVRHLPFRTRSSNRMLAMMTTHLHTICSMTGRQQSQTPHSCRHLHPWPASIARLRMPLTMKQQRHMLGVLETTSTRLKCLTCISLRRFRQDNTNSIG